MKGVRTIAWLLLVTAGLVSGMEAGAQGKWSGQLALTGGFGQTPVPKGSESLLDTLNRYRGQIDLQINYVAPKFSLLNTLGFVCDQNRTQSVKDYLAFNEQGGQESQESSNRFGLDLQMRGNIRTEVQWRPSSRNRFTWFAAYQNGAQNTSFLSVIQTRPGSRDVREGIKSDIASEGFGNWNFGMLSTHGLGRRAMPLDLSLEARLNERSRQQDWVDVASEGALSAYSILSSRLAAEIRFTASWRDTIQLASRPLVLEPGFRSVLRLELDSHGGRVLDAGGQWRDSLRLEESFDYLSADLNPCLLAIYRTEHFRFQADYALQCFGKSLSDDTHEGDLVFDHPRVVGRSTVEWRLSESYSLVLGNTLSSRQPTYLQTCRYERKGTYDDQLIRGNPELLPAYSYGFDLTWRFRYHRFRLSANTSFTRREHEIEQDFWTQTIDGRDYRLFSWFNTAYGNTFAGGIDLGWQGSVLVSGLQVSYEQKRQWALLADKTSDSHLWNLAARVGLQPVRGWSASVSGRYRGDVKTFYSILEKYCTVDGRVEKSFAKWTVFAEGLDLLDHPLVETYLSPDGRQTWSETRRLNRRRFQLGFNWRF